MPRKKGDKLSKEVVLLVSQSINQSQEELPAKRNRGKRVVSDAPPRKASMHAASEPRKSKDERATTGIVAKTNLQ